MFRNAKHTLFMFVAAFIWGSAFVPQRMGMEFIGPIAYNAWRSLIGCVAICIAVAIFNRSGAVQQFSTRRARRDLIAGGFWCGIFLTIPTLLQQVGLQYTTAGKAGFVTALYILFVPMAGLFTGRRMPPFIWPGVAIALVGMYLLCVKDGFTVSKGDLYVFGCAVTFTAHIYAIDHFAKKVDGMLLCCAQFIMCGAISTALAFAFEGPTVGEFKAAFWPIMYTGVMSSGVAYTLQILSQRRISPAVAAIVMSMESVFAVLCGWVVLGERLSWREALGCVLVFVATLLAQIPRRQQQQDNLTDQ